MSVYHCSAPFKGCCGNGWLPQLPPFPIPKRRFGSPCWPNPSNLRLPIAAKIIDGKLEKEKKKVEISCGEIEDTYGILKKYFKLKNFEAVEVHQRNCATFPEPQTCLINYFILCLFLTTSLRSLSSILHFFHLRFQFSSQYFFFIFHPNPIGKFSILAFSNSSFPIFLRWFFFLLRFFFSLIHCYFKKFVCSTSTNVNYKLFPNTIVNHKW